MQTEQERAAEREPTTEEIDLVPGPPDQESKGEEGDDQQGAEIGAMPLLIEVLVLDEDSSQQELEHAIRRLVEAHVAGEPYIVDEDAEPTPWQQELPVSPEPIQMPWWNARRPLVLLLSVFVLMGVLGVFLVPWWETSVTITLIPVHRQVSASRSVTLVTSGTAAAGQVQGRMLSTVTISQQRNVPTTGQGQQEAQAAHGTITLYNALPAVQVIPAGTLLTSASGVQVVTDQQAVLPAGSLASNGMRSVQAHALVVGPQGNIAAQSIYGPCCRANVFAQNQSAFTGGQLARHFPIVSQQDVDGPTVTLRATLQQSVQAALQSQVHEGETLITPLSCTSSVHSDHQVGEEAAQVQVVVQEQCQGVVYQTQGMHELLLSALREQAATTGGAGDALVGEIQVDVQAQTQASDAQGHYLVHTQAQGTWVGQFSERDLQRMAGQVAGMSKREATARLLQMPGVSQVMMDLSGGEDATLPRNAGNIHLVVLYQPA